jgi:two-component system, LytTR family, response regulator LytT
MKLKVLIIEDEIYAQEHLIRQLQLIEPNITILDKLESVNSAVTWLKKNTADLIFMDIQLSDGISFSIFDEVKVTAPIIFTTAYDAYAIQAFKVNSIDYLLKPIDEDDLSHALEKFKTLSQSNLLINIASLKAALVQPTNQYQERFVVHRGEKILSITIDQIAYFEGEDRYVYLVKKDGSRFIVDYKLSDLIQILSPNIFYRLNRSFITSFDAIKGMTNLSKSRVKVELIPTPKREVIVSSENNQDFKKWLNS